MKVNATASNFRALVQRLTGRDSGLKVPDRAGEGWAHQEVDPPYKMKSTQDHHDHALEVEEQPLDEPAKESGSGSGSGSGSRSDSSLDGYDDVYMPQMLENLPEILSSNWWYESTHVE
ncbi:hypothetical protein LguiB_004145 [Lonicera macranthoides]